MIDKILSGLSGIHHRDHLGARLRRHRSDDGDRKRLHAVAVGSDNAVFGLAGRERPLQPELVAIAGAVGCLLGSYVAYFAGAYGGRRFLRALRALAIDRAARTRSRRSLLRASGDRRPCSSAACCRSCAPSSLFPRAWRGCVCCPFTIYTLIGSYIWCLVLAYAGLKLGQHWKELAPVFPSLRHGDRSSACHRHRTTALQSNQRDAAPRNDGGANR